MNKKSNFLMYLFPALILLCVVFSCKTPAPVSEPEAPLPVPEIAAETAVEDQIPPPGDISETHTSPAEPEWEGETLELIFPLPAPAETEQELPEPVFALPPLPPPVLPALPEPVLPEPLLSPLEPPAEPQPEEPIEELTEQLPVLPPEAPPPAQRETPPPPPVLRPPEPAPPPPARETPPVPFIPEPPSRVLPEPVEEPLVFSRVVRATVGQMIEIPFRGTGWVYLGELGNRRGISYDSRRLDITAGVVEGQSFIFRAGAVGTYILRFYRQDFIQDFIINDHVQVMVGEPEDTGTGRLLDRGRVIAEPRWPPAPGSETRPIAQEPAPPGETQVSAAPATVPDEDIEPPLLAQSAETLPPEDEIAALVYDPLEEYVRRARLEFDAGRIEEALHIMDAMRQHYPLGSDEAWWLYGQLFEANSSARDIRLSLDYYRRLIIEYPQSHRAGAAHRRIAYLERYYINIR